MLAFWIYQNQQQITKKNHKILKELLNINLILCFTCSPPFHCNANAQERRRGRPNIGILPDDMERLKEQSNDQHSIILVLI